MSKSYLRIYKEFDITDVEKHLLIMGDLKADCSACRALGISFDAHACPECGVQFKYLSSRRADQHEGERFRIVKRAQEQRPDLTFIDYGDYHKVVGKKKARDFFG
ncbi:MAG: hypothetical protein Q8R76_11290 [Candidatus Omnitrophota bacterium]|nr:hypothetical protein [Candidatus Omnitrophota bacterium]